ncbi:hypothetical protein PVAND_002066 [Polypedilum vanderplanki]|uniref:Osiris 10 n=1 Tax=Polypedilum vanderplanki TaxID=319348 RepID=A0A9J6BPU5_POLVA|nr:hypothetical protein PVAND_002066 [Polypedilum vanderplanki]
MLLQVISIYYVIIMLIESVNCGKDEFHFETFGHCIKQQDKPDLVKCAGKQILETFEQFNSVENFTLTKGLILSKDDSAMGRNNPINFLDQDPSDIRALLENAGLAVSSRSVQWDMSRLYPGLQLRIGPGVNGGLLEFIVDPSTVYDERSHLLHEESTARIMTRKFVLPFLLGLKFNLATLLPLILGLIILISKKAAFLSKLALFITGLFGLSGIYSLGGGFKEHGYGNYGFGGIYPAAYYPPPVFADTGAIHHHSSSHAQFASPYKILESNTPPNEQLEDNFYEFEKQQLLKDRSARLYEREIDRADIKPKYQQSNQRNFVWQTAN